MNGDKGRDLAKTSQFRLSDREDKDGAVEFDAIILKARKGVRLPILKKGRKIYAISEPYGLPLTVYRTR